MCLNKAKVAHMVLGPLAIALVASLNLGVASAQSGNPAGDAAYPPKPVIGPELRGDVFMAKKQYREAIDAFKEGSPKDPVLWNKRGIAYHQMLQLDNAIRSYEQAVRLKGDYVEAINNIGTVYYARKNYRRSITYYLKALKIAPRESKSASIYSNLGAAYFSRKQYDEAAAAFQQAMELDPEVFERHGTYGIMLEERNVQERAKYHYYLAKLSAKNGRNEQALQYLRKALEEGFKEKKQLLTDPEFEPLRELKEFKDLLALEPRVL
jgi:tetratricopeptide (TPR) repeat protein